MKKRILALLLAGLLTMSAASCVASGSQNDTDDGTENNQTTTTSDDETTTKNPTLEWTESDKTVYTTSSVKLRSAASTTGAEVTTIPKASELHCKRVSATWSEVEYNGQTGYVSNAYITDSDILGKTLTPVPGGSKTMYVTLKNQNLTIRLYASAEEFSDKIGYFSFGDEVKVVATGENWCRIEYTDKDGKVNNYYVNAAYLSDTKPTDPDDLTQYEHLFQPCTTADMYVMGPVWMRVAPSMNASQLVVLTKGTKVTVTKKGTTTDKITWYYGTAVLPPEKDGDPSRVFQGYVSASYLGDTVEAGKATLDDIIALYPPETFTKVNKTMYVTTESGGLWVRSTPDLDVEENKVGSLTVKAEVKVVATGNYNDNNWCIIEYTPLDGESGYYFVGAAKLTSDPNGEIVLTLDELLLKYSNFSAKGFTVVAKGTVNCYTSPATTATPATTLTAGTEVTVVAEETGSVVNLWYIVKTADGKLYFVAKDLFELKVAG
ncbi:MAG: SH3 domain-containing protein [Clostridia bacterium]|nr:SH3 domain-containing protein [Clostridia bacterium]